MRGEIAAALLHEPELLVLDEPTVGLDVLSKERLRAVLREEREQHGRTLLLTTHDMGDVERLCERLLVVDRGRLVYDGDLPGLVARVGVRRVVSVDLEGPAAELRGVPGAELVGSEGDGVRQRLRLEPGTTAAAVISAVAARAPLRDVTIEEPDIEEVVRLLYRARNEAALEGETEG
jgi:ABC-2 type transport system ATP-binding protein